MQSNPWVNDRGLGSVKDVLNVARSTGHRLKDSSASQSSPEHVVSPAAPSLRMIGILRDIKHKKQELEKINLEIQQLLQDSQTRDITHNKVLQPKIAKITELNNHLEELIKSKQFLINRLQQPYVKDYLPLEVSCHKSASEFLPKIVPTLSDLAIQLDNLEWINRLDESVADLNSLLSDVSATVGTHQMMFHDIVNLRQMMWRRQQVSTRAGIDDIDEENDQPTATPVINLINRTTADTTGSSSGTLNNTRSTVTSVDNDRRL